MNKKVEPTSKIDLLTNHSLVRKANKPNLHTLGWIHNSLACVQDALDAHTHDKQEQYKKTTTENHNLRADIIYCSVFYSACTSPWWGVIVEGKSELQCVRYSPANPNTKKTKTKKITIS